MAEPLQTEKDHIPLRGWAFIVTPFALVLCLSAAVVIEAVIR